MFKGKESSLLAPYLVGSMFVLGVVMLAFGSSKTRLNCGSLMKWWWRACCFGSYLASGWVDARKNVLHVNKAVFHCCDWTDPKTTFRCFADCCITYTYFCNPWYPAILNIIIQSYITYTDTIPKAKILNIHHHKYIYIYILDDLGLCVCFFWNYDIPNFVVGRCRITLELSRAGSDEVLWRDDILG